MQERHIEVGIATIGVVAPPPTVPALLLGLEQPSVTQLLQEHVDPSAVDPSRQPNLLGR